MRAVLSFVVPQMPNTQYAEILRTMSEVRPACSSYHVHVRARMRLSVHFEEKELIPPFQYLRGAMIPTHIFFAAPRYPPCWYGT